MEWKKLIEHVHSKFEDKYWFEDVLYEESVDEFIIGAGGSDDESSSESDTSSDIEDLNNFCTSFYIIFLYALFLSYIYIYNMFALLHLACISIAPCM